MKSKKSVIGIVGHGFVGQAVDYAFSSPRVKKVIVDPKHGHDGHTIADLANANVHATFVCLPTPMSGNGSIDSSLVEEAVNYLKLNVIGLIIVKSTVTPDIMQALTSGVSGHRVVYNPEFLTQKSANHDFVNPSMHIFGGHPTQTAYAEKLYKKYSMCKPCPSFHMTAKDASFVKYAINSYLATKVTWFNQLYDIVNKNGGNYNTIINAVTSDERVGTSHTSVPGYDGTRGYGGACFPKDTSAFLSFAENFSLLRGTIDANNELRGNHIGTPPK